jgi:hypothetical protein
MVHETNAAISRVLDQPFIFVCELLVNLARGLRGRGCGAAPFNLLTKEQVIDIHNGLRFSPLREMEGSGERQMSWSRLVD